MILYKDWLNFFITEISGNKTPHPSELYMSLKCGAVMLTYHKQDEKLM
jgi:hypothetical protein